MDISVYDYLEQGGLQGNFAALWQLYKLNFFKVWVQLCMYRRFEASTKENESKGFSPFRRSCSIERIRTIALASTVGCKYRSVYALALNEVDVSTGKLRKQDLGPAFNSKTRDPIVVKRALIYVHFDMHGKIDPYVVDSIEKYRQHFGKIIFVSPSVRALPREIDLIVDQFVPRKNEGYDFGSWRDGLKSLTNVNDYDEVFFLNDSVYGPLKDLGSTLDFGIDHGFDFWGMVLSLQSPYKTPPIQRPHLQSWFFVAGKSVLQSDVFKQFWTTIDQLPSKKEIVHRYEVGMSEAIQKAGFKMGAVFDARSVEEFAWREIRGHLRVSNFLRMIKQIRRARRLNYNPSELRILKMWEEGVPYLKSSVFRTNHYALNTNVLLEALSRYFDYDQKIIRDHQSRVQGRA